MPARGRGPGLQKIVNGAPGGTRTHDHRLTSRRPLGARAASMASRKSAPDGKCIEFDRAAADVAHDEKARFIHRIERIGCAASASRCHATKHAKTDGILSKSSRWLLYEGRGYAFAMAFKNKHTGQPRASRQYWRNGPAPALVVTVLCVGRALAQSEDWHQEQRARALYLCEWRAANGLANNNWRLDVCSNPDVPIGPLLVQYDRWWGSLFEHNKIEVGEQLRDKFKADWLASAEYQRLQNARREELERAEAAEAQRQRHFNERAQMLADQEAERQRAEERKTAEIQRVRARERRKQELVQAEREAADRRAKFDLIVKGLSDNDLCAAFHSTGYQSASAELQRRNALPVSEWNLIAQHKVAIGMSETALLCSWGRARMNRTLTGAGERDQYIYGEGTYVYVENGRVIAIQDRQ